MNILNNIKYNYSFFQVILQSK